MRTWLTGLFSSTSAFLLPVIVSTLFVPVLTESAKAITINLQYSPGTLFYSGIDGTAKAAINAAAADISTAITSSLDAITTDVYAGTNGSTTTAFDWDSNYNNPNGAGSITINSPTAATNTITIFVGTRSLPGNTLGQGGPAGIGFVVQANGQPSEAPAAISQGAALSQDALTRGGGPVIGTLEDTWNWAGYTQDYSVDYGISYGSLSFDIDSNNNGAYDSAAQLDDYWHWNHNTTVGSGKNDLYSVALHEMLHALGLGASESWDDQTSGSSWNGAEVQAITGSGSNLIHGGGSHIASGIMSTRISDGSPQEVVMDPNITQGTRKELTELDLAFLRDIGYETITQATDPADFNSDGYVNAADLTIWQGGFGSSSAGDTDADGDTDGSDFLAWQQQYTGNGSTLSAVPEPASLGMLLLGTFLLTGRRR